MNVARSTYLFSVYLTIGVWLMPFLGLFFHEKCMDRPLQPKIIRLLLPLVVGISIGMAYLLFHILIVDLPYRLLAFGLCAIVVTLIVYVLSDQSTFTFAVCPIFFMTGLMEFFFDPSGRPFAAHYLAPTLSMLVLFISTLIVGFVLVWGRYIDRLFPDVKDRAQGTTEAKIRLNRWVRIGVNYCLIINAYFWIGVVLVFISGIELEQHWLRMLLGFIR